MKAYALDFVGIQEIKITCFKMLPFVHLSPWNRLYCFSKVRPALERYWSVSDRVGVPEFALPVTRRSRTNKLYVIVAYGPQLCADNPQTRDNFFDSLDRAWKQTKEGKSLTYIAGDFNSKMGCQQSVEEDCIWESMVKGRVMRMVRPWLTGCFIDNFSSAILPLSTLVIIALHGKVTSNLMDLRQWCQSAIPLTS